MTAWAPSEPGMRVDPQRVAERRERQTSLVLELGARARECAGERAPSALTLRLQFDPHSRAVQQVRATDRNGIAIDGVDWATTAEVAQRLAASYDDWWLPNDENRLGDVTWLVFEYADDGGIRSWSGPVVLDGTADPTLSCADIGGVVRCDGDAVGDALVCAIAGNEALVVAGGAVAPPDQQSLYVAQCRSDAAGCFDLQVKLPEHGAPEVVIVAFADGRASVPLVHRVRSACADVGMIDLRGAASVLVEVGSRGGAVSGAEVSVLVSGRRGDDVDEPVPGSYWVSTVTDEAGRADLGVVAVPRHASLGILASHACHPPVPMDWQVEVEGGVRWHLELPEGRAVAGRLLDVSGRPVCGARLRTRSSATGFGAVDQTVENAADGSFRIQGVKPSGDVIDVFVERTPEFERPRHCIVVAPETADSIGDIVLPKARTLAGRLLIDGAPPHAPATVLLGVPEGAVSGPCVGPDGRFRFEGLADITWQVSVHTDGSVMSFAPRHLDLRIPDDGVVLLSLDSTGFRATTSDGVTLASAGP